MPGGASLGCSSLPCSASGGRARLAVAPLWAGMFSVLLLETQLGLKRLPGLAWASPALAPFWVLTQAQRRLCSRFLGVSGHPDDPFLPQQPEDRWPPFPTGCLVSSSSGWGGSWPPSIKC